MELFAWGANSYGQLGLGYKNEQILEPTIVNLQNINVCDIISISAGAGHTIILTKNGLLYSCGWNTKGQLGLESETLLFTNITALNKIVQISCGWDFSAAISDLGNLFVWGSNAFSQLNLSKNIKYTSKPTLIENIKAKQISCGLRHIAVVTFDGKVLVAGNNSKGQLGLADKSENGKLVRESCFKILPELIDIISVSCGQYHTVALKSDGTIFCWGSNKHGECGFNPELHQNIFIPTELKLNICVKEIHTGWTHTIILTKDDDIFNFGRNIYGQLGDKRSCNWKGAILKCDKVNKISVGSEHNLAINYDKKLLCWGWNEHGNCGTGNVENVEFPEQILKQKKVFYVSAGTGQSFAIVEK